MTRFRIGVGLLVVLLAVCLFFQLGMGAIQKPIAAQVEQARTLADQGDWSGAQGALAEAQTAWARSRTFLAALADHQPLEDIECLLATLESYAADREKTEFCASCADVIRRILAVKEAQEFNLGSLL